MLKLIGPFTCAAGMVAAPLKGPLRDEGIRVYKNAGLLIDDEVIRDLGAYSELKKNNSKVELIEIDEPSCLVPGYIDAHTHIAFAGTRARDFALRNAGSSYLEISKAGGGIWDTVQQTRKASKSELLASILNRSEKLLKQGITTVEVKSGYGLSLDQEGRILACIKSASELAIIDLVSTCLAAHVPPRDYNGTFRGYLEEIANGLLPRLQSNYNCSRVDIFIEQTAFQINESRDYLKMAKKLGLDITIHADQFTPMGSYLAVEMGAISADHLEASRKEEIKLLAGSDVVAVALPGASVGLGEPFAPARELLNQGACLAIASDWNPGSAPMGQLMTQASILATYEHLTCAEVLAGLTFRAAKALNLTDRGRLSEGYLADFCIYPVGDFREIVYYQGGLRPRQVWKRGKQIL